MKLLKAQIENYKCFRSSGEIELGPGFNVFIGKNDAGKSALLEALSARATYAPHRSLESASHASAQNSVRSEFRFSYDVGGAELHEMFCDQQGVTLPIYLAHQTVAKPELAQDGFLNAVDLGDEFNVVMYTFDRTTPAFAHRGALGKLVLMNPEGEYRLFNNLAYPIGINLSLTSTQGGQQYFRELSAKLTARIYAFRAERLTLARSATRGGDVLLPNASNLPEVLNILQTNYTHLWQHYLSHVRTILPHITEIKAVYTPSNEVEIRISTSEPSLSRFDLDVSLSDSGTGIGQVLAILYVVVRYTTPHVILIDEPQSFLHPGAIRKLLEILRTYGHHQYIITTHSPLAFSLSDTDRMFQVSRGKDGSQVKAIEGRDDLIGALSDVGARIGDVYGAESVLWVEGPTEERCFPEIIHGVAKKQLHGTVIVGVVTTGELEGRDAKRIAEIYERLTNCNALLPKTLAFLFDREGRSEGQTRELTTRLRGLMHWLPLRMFENYLLDAGAIASVLSELVGESGPSISCADVNNWLMKRGGEPRFFDHDQALPYGHADWRLRVHGAKVLDSIFFDLTKDFGAHEYQKVKHGLLLTRYLVSHPTDDLKRLSDFLSGILESGDGDN